jgi:hypothetical protein
MSVRPSGSTELPDGQNIIHLFIVAGAAVIIIQIKGV